MVWPILLATIMPWIVHTIGDLNKEWISVVKVFYCLLFIKFITLIGCHATIQRNGYTSTSLVSVSHLLHLFMWDHPDVLSFCLKAKEKSTSFCEKYCTANFALSNYLIRIIDIHVKANALNGERKSRDELSWLCMIIINLKLRWNKLEFLLHISNGFY